MVYGETVARRRLRPWMLELLLLAAVYGVYELVRALTGSNETGALENARNLMSLQHTLHLTPEHWLNHQFTVHSFLAVPACYLYAVCHYTVTPAVMFWMWHAHHRHYRSARSIIVTATLLGLIGFWLAPMAPPRSVGMFTDTMAQWSNIGWWGDAGSVPSGMQGLTDQFAAMPSLHVGWAVWCGWALFRYADHRWLKVLGVAYPIATVLVVIGTANHYFLDAVAGTFVIAFSGALVALFNRIWANRMACRMITHAQESSTVDRSNRALSDH
ncbi:MAG TPA: phosphatase PAP2 family protein [Mycobacteriales bacterium]|nr:phosphatase PAP2 family protein [Mycobacteriales bacterium]